MSRKKNDNIIEYRSPFHINIGIIVFAFVLIYFLIYLISYLTDKHVSIYEVQQGQIVRNEYYTGLVLRDEEVSYAEQGGSINYYAKEGDKVGVDDLICSIDKNGDISSEITQAGLNGTTLSKDELLTINTLITDYTGNQSDMQFYNIYSFKNNINENVQENLYLNALDALSSETQSAIQSKTFSLVEAQKDGVVAFYTDGYEDVTLDNFDGNIYNPTHYVKSNLKSESNVSNGDPLYKTISSENWYILIPLTPAESTYYRTQQGSADSFVTQVDFRKDQSSIYAYASVKTFGTENYLCLTMNSSMIRFLSDRYLEIELGANNISGLKIPNTAITEKEFIKIPVSYFTTQTDPEDPDKVYTGVYKATKGRGDNYTTEFVRTELYYEEGTYYFIDEDELQIGDMVQKPDSTQVYTLEDTSVLKGVYNMNKGYAIFKQIDVLSSNEEYSILATGTEYGLSLYDRIALDGTAVHDGEFAH